MGKKFLPENLAILSKNDFIRRQKWKGWYCIAGIDFVIDANVLLKDALRNLRINGKLFRESEIFLNLPDDFKRTAQLSDPSPLEPAFKQFVKSELFPALSDTLAEKEYKRLQYAYGQPVAGAGLNAVNNSACERFLENPNITASLTSGSKVDNVTYKYGTYFLDSHVTDLIYSYCDLENSSDAYTTTLSTTLIYGSVMPDTQISFATNFFDVSNSFSEALIVQQNVDVKKLIELENYIQNKNLINEYYQACENYKTDLKKYFRINFASEDKALAQYLISESSMLLVDSIINGYRANSLPSEKNIINTSKDTGLDNLVASHNMEEKIATFSKPAQLAVRKYKVMCDMQKALLAKNELKLDSVRNFASLLEEKRALLTTNRDTGIETFFKVVASIATLGIAAPYLFSTRGDKFIETVSAVFNKTKNKPQEEAEPLKVHQASIGYAH